MNKFISTLIVLLAMCMKVKSVLFSEMRNKLGNQIVGTSWKGRMVFRAYKIPANPKSIKQQAVRDHQKKALAWYQTVVIKGSAEADMWDVDALPRSISGYNLFMKLSRSSKISCDATGTTNVEQDITYTIQHDLSTQGLYAHTVSADTYLLVAAPGTLESGTDKTKPFTPLLVDTYEFFIVDDRSKTYPPTSAQEEGMHGHWTPNESTGVADPADSVISAP